VQPNPAHGTGALVAALRDEIEPVQRAHQQLFLPKYSPDLNPIEQVFAKLKHVVRKASVRTQTDPTRAVGDLLGTFTSDQCANYFRNSGYNST
jgi:transposase